jgi:hypothetical protein
LAPALLLNLEPEGIATLPRTPASRSSPIERALEYESYDGGASGERGAALDAITRRYLERLLGHPPTREDAALIPGINLSDLGADTRGPLAPSPGRCIELTPAARPTSMPVSTNHLAARGIGSRRPTRCTAPQRGCDQRESQQLPPKPQVTYDVRREIAPD